MTASASNLELETVSGTHKLRIFAPELAFQPTPVVFVPDVIGLLVQNGNDVDDMEVPPGLNVIPNRPDLPITKKIVWISCESFGAKITLKKRFMKLF